MSSSPTRHIDEFQKMSEGLQKLSLLTRNGESGSSGKPGKANSNQPDPVITGFLVNQVRTEQYQL